MVLLQMIIQARISILESWVAVSIHPTASLWIGKSHALSFEKSLRDVEHGIVHSRAAKVEAVSGSSLSPPGLAQP
jgi:hypothetical protein